MRAYVAPAIAAPTMGPTMNNQIWASAALPANQATPNERARFSEVPVMGMLARWIRVKPRPIAIGAKPLGAVVRGAQDDVEEDRGHDDLGDQGGEEPVPAGRAITVTVRRKATLHSAKPGFARCDSQ